MTNNWCEDEVNNCFTYHKPRNSQLARYSNLRSWAKSFAEKVLEYTPDSRERDVAIQKVEEAVFWANAAIARRDYE